MKLIKQIENLPLEEYLALEAKMVQTVQTPVLFTWIVEPTVIYGKHQIREQEVNDRYCEEHSIRVVQRQSGGGCVYADRGNLMISYVSPSTHSQEVFETLTAKWQERLVTLRPQARWFMPRCCMRWIWRLWSGQSPLRRRNWRNMRWRRCGNECETCAR